MDVSPGEADVEAEEERRTQVLSNASAQRKSARKRLRKVLRLNPATLPLKVTLFLFYGAMAAILPYLTLHMQDIGISIQEVAIIYAILPFTTFIGPPLMGLLADRWGEYKRVLVLATIGTGLFNTLLLVVPRVKVTTPTTPTLLQWNPFSNEALILPSSPEWCESFSAHHVNVSNLTLHFLTHCERVGLENGTSSAVHEYEHVHVHGEERREEGLLQLIEDVSGAELIEDGEGWEADNAHLHLTLDQERDYCSLRVSNKFLRRSDGLLLTSNASVIRCRTSLEFPTGEKVLIGHPGMTFWVYFFLRFLGNTFMSCCFTLLDATTLAVVKSSSGSAEYGKERIWSVLGLASVSPIAGVLVDTVSRERNSTDYSPAFYLSNALLLLNILAYTWMKLQVEKPERAFLKNAGELLRYPEVVVFLLMIFLMGSLWGFVESYLFIFLKELEAPNYLLGLTWTVGALTGIPFLWGSEMLLSRLGRVNVLILAFLTYFLRYLGYSYITDPFWCFPFEAMEAVTYHLMWSAAATYCAVLAPPGLLATLTGIMGSLHYSLGKGNGSFIGGILFGELGARLTFRVFGIAAGLFGLLFCAIDFLWIQGVVARRTAKHKGVVEGEGVDPQMDSAPMRMTEKESGREEVDMLSPPTSSS